MKACPSKVRYRDELSAKIALASAQGRDKGEKRAYRCPHCKGYHLTSQEPDPNRSRRNPG